MNIFHFERNEILFLLIRYNVNTNEMKLYEENILSDDTLVSEELNNFFQNATKTLNINENSYIADYSSSITGPVDKAINTYKNHLQHLVN